MFWSLSLQLMPGETILEDSTGKHVEGLKPSYSVFLTNKRAVFRLDGFGSRMAQSFLYDEVAQAQPVRRMFITYLRLTTRSKEYFLHIPAPEYWAARLREAAKQAASADEASAAAGAMSRKQQEDLHRMLDALRQHGILTDAEYSQKVKLLNERKG